MRRSRDGSLLRHYPVGPLSTHVEFIAARKAVLDAPAALRIIPTARVEILFNFGDPWHIGIDRDGMVPMPSAAILPARKGAYLQNAGPQIDWVLMALTPLGCRTILGSDLADLWAIDGRQFIAAPALLQAVFERLRPFGESEQRFQAAVSEVGQLAAWDSSCEFLEEVHSARLTPVATVDELAASLSITSRQLRNRFRKAIGISPKHYLRLMRFNRHLSAMHPDPWLVEEQAKADELFDDSHAIREFKMHIGITPTEYLRSKAERKDRLIYTF